MKTQLYLYEITRYLAAFTSQVKIENQRGNFDINKYAESFVLPLFSFVFKKDFERLELLKVNFPSIDLRSKDQQIAIQVTAETGFNKIKETLAAFISHKYYEKSRLLHFIIDEDYSTQKKDNDIKLIIDAEIEKLKLPETPKIDFTLSNIWNVSTLIKEIEKNCDVSELEKIRDFLKSQYGDVTSLQSFNDVLIPYQIAFESQIKPQSANLPFQFNNPFFGREADMKSLADFIANENQNILTIVADGGYGKTRLCIEFFQKNIDTSGDTQAFVLNDKAFKGELFPHQEPPTKGTIVLVDDAHRKTEILDSLLNSAKRNKNVKLILTVRKALYEDTMKAFATHSRNIPTIPLKRLSYDNTLDLIKSQVPGLGEGERVRMADQSKGVPVVVLGLCQVVRNGKYSSELSEEDNFIRFVRELKEQIISDISEKYFVDPKNINKVIQLLSLLGPLKNTEEEIKSLADLNEISFEESSIILTYLAEHEFVQQKNEISIISDPYADVILLDTAPRINFLLRKSGIEIFLDRIIRNLVEVEHSERLKLNVDSIIIEFISSIIKNPLTNYQLIKELDNNLDTMKHFAYKKPTIVFKAIELLVNAKADDPNFWKTTFDNWNFSQLRGVHESIHTILGIVALNTHSEDGLTAILNLVQYLIKRRSDYNVLTKVFRYRQYDFYEYRYNPPVSCERQLFLTKYLKTLASKDAPTEFEIQFLLTGAILLLRLDFALDTVFDKYKHTFSHGTAQVIENETTTNIRNQAIDILITLFWKIRNTENSNKVYDVLLRMLHFTVTPTQKGYVLDQSQQLARVEKFLFELMSSDPSIEEKARLLRQLQLYAKREIKAEYVALSQKLGDIAGIVKSNREKIELLLREEYFFKRKYLDTELRKVIESYKDWKTFYQDTIIIFKIFQGVDIQNFNWLLDHLINEHPAPSKELFEFVLEKHPELTLDFCDLVRANYLDKDYFDSKIELLWKIDTVATRQAVIYLLTVGRKHDKTLYRKSDLDYIESAINEGNQGALYRLSVTLPDFMDLDDERTLKLCEKFIEVDTGRNSEMLIHSLYEQPEFVSQHKEKLKEFAFNKTLELRLDSHYYNFIFLFLERNFGFEVLFSYLLKKIDFLEKEGGLHTIDFSGTHVNPDLSQAQLENNFVKVIEWFASIDEPSEYVHSKLVEFFKPAGIFTASLKTKIQELIAGKGADLNYILKICKALDVYEDKDGELLTFLIFVGNQAVKLKEYSKDKLMLVFGHDFVLNHGGRSKAGPGPYPQDLDRSASIKSALEKYDMEDDVKEIFRYSLKKVEDSVRREEKSDSDSW